MENFKIIKEQVNKIEKKRYCLIETRIELDLRSSLMIHLNIKTKFDKFD